MPDFYREQLFSISLVFSLSRFFFSSLNLIMLGHVYVSGAIVFLAIVSVCENLILFILCIRPLFISLNIKHISHFFFILGCEYICSRASLCVCEHICLILKCVWLCIITCLQHCTQHNKLLIAVCRRSLYVRGWRRKLGLAKVCMCKSTTQNKRKSA